MGAVLVTFYFSRFVVPAALKKVPIPVGALPAINVGLPIAILAASFWGIYLPLAWYYKHVEPLADLQKIEQVQASVQVTLGSVNGRVAGIEKLPPGSPPSQIRESINSAGVELDSALQHIKESSAAISARESSFEGGSAPFGNEVMQQWQKLKQRQAQMTGRAEDLRSKLTSFPIPPEPPQPRHPSPLATASDPPRPTASTLPVSEQPWRAPVTSPPINEPPRTFPPQPPYDVQQLKSTAVAFVNRYYDNLGRADVGAVSDMWVPEQIPSKLSGMVRNCSHARVNCLQVSEITPSSAKVRIDATVSSKNSSKSSRYVLTFDLRGSGGGWKLNQQMNPRDVSTATASCLAE